VRVLLDTQSWLWLVGDAARFSKRTRKLVADPGNELVLSAVSSWEIAIKHSIGKLELPGEPEDVLPGCMARSAVTPLAVLHSHALRLASLPFHHADPFDRLLIAQAQLEDLAVVTSDSAFRDYEVEVIAA
jgi:PIN domain nuclease of toxin-antitoxin system